MPPPSRITPDQSRLFLDLLDQLARVDPEFPLHYSICLVQIAMNEGISCTQLSERTGIALSTISRIVGALSNYRQNGQAYGLIDLRIAVNERRRKELYLTPKGWAVMRGVSSVLDAYRGNSSGTPVSRKSGGRSA